MDPPFDVRYTRLSREVALAANLLGVGFTMLRQHGLGTHGYFDASLFNLVGGLERLGKVILLLDHEVLHGIAMPEAKLKAFNHDLKKLFAEMASVGQRYKALTDSPLADPIAQAILNSLHVFAVHARYYNLNWLSGAIRGGDVEPMQRWHNEVDIPLMKRHPPRPSRKRLAAQQVAHYMHAAGKVSVIQTGPRGEAIHDAVTAVQVQLDIEHCRRYAVYYSYQIVAFLRTLLCAVQDRLPQGHYLHEHLGMFAGHSRAEVMKRRRWTL
jgi:hypothetical protein